MRDDARCRKTAFVGRHLSYAGDLPQFRQDARRISFADPKRQEWKFVLMPVKNAGQSKVVVITGGGRGIGLTMARTFVGNGYSVVITGRDMKRLQHAASELSKEEAQVTGIP